MISLRNRANMSPSRNEGIHEVCPSIGGISEPRWVRVTFQPTRCAPRHTMHRRRAQTCPATDTPLFPCRIAPSLGNVRTERWFTGTEQSETPVPPKVDFETRGPKAAENGREIVSTG